MALRLSLFGVLVAFLIAPAEAFFLNYTDWTALPEGSRTMFMTGAFDSLVSFANNEGGAKAADHYEQCIRDAHMSNTQLAANVLNYAKDKPALHTKPATIAMIQYLIAACGLPPQRNPK
jgi:hypothetical protein